MSRRRTMSVHQSIIVWIVPCCHLLHVDEVLACCARSLALQTVRNVIGAIHTLHQIASVVQWDMAVLMVVTLLLQLLGVQLLH